jgi:hypothetical protein
MESRLRARLGVMNLAEDRGSAKLLAWKLGRSGKLLLIESKESNESLESDLITLRRGVRAGKSDITQHGLGEGDAQESPLLARLIESRRCIDLSSLQVDSSSEFAPSYASFILGRREIGVRHPAPLISLFFFLKKNRTSFSWSPPEGGSIRRASTTHIENPSFGRLLALSSVRFAAEVVPLAEEAGAFR